MSASLRHVSQPARSITGGLNAAPVESAYFVLRLSDEQARNPIPFLPTWLDRVRDSGARRAVIDMADVYRLDLSGFGLLLAKLRDVLGVTVVVRGIGPTEAVSLQSMGLLEGVSVERRRHRG
jgi:hypothetical protein